MWRVGEVSPFLSSLTLQGGTFQVGTLALQKDFRRLEEIYDQKRHKSLPSVGNTKPMAYIDVDEKDIN